MPTPTTRCCRAVHRRLQTQRDRYGISEAALAAIIEHYVASLGDRARHASFVPGPLENRRRQGRRHMGELSLARAAPSAAPWQPQYLPDLTGWRWRPPSSQGNRIVQQLIGRSSIIGRAVATALYPARALRHAITALFSAAESVPSPLTCETPMEYIDIGFARLGQDISLDRSLSSTPKFLSFCQQLEQSLSSGRLGGPDVWPVFINLYYGIDALKWKELCGPEALSKVQDLMLVLLRSVARGIHNSNVDIGHDRQLYGDLLYVVSAIRQKNTIQTLTAVTACIPKAFLGSLGEDIQRNMVVFFEAVKETDSLASTIRQVNKLARTWQNLSSAQHVAILNTATEKVLDYLQTDAADFSKIRLAWLSLLARLPYVSTEYLARACAFTEAGLHTPALSQKHVCKLLVIHLERHGSLRYTGEVASILDGRHQFFQLGMYLGQHRYLVNLFFSARFLSSAGRDQDVNSLLKGAKRGSQTRGSETRRKISSLFDLAVDSGSRITAMQILKTAVTSPGLVGKRFWKDEKSLESVSSILAQRKVSRRKVFSLLQLDRFRRGRHAASRGWHSSDVQTLKAARLAQAAAANMDMSVKTAFDTVFRCVHYVKRHRGNVPSSLLRSVHEVIKRDVKAGKAGVSVRMLWYLDLIGKECGLTVKVRTAEALLRWRDWNRARAAHAREQEEGRFDEDEIGAALREEYGTPNQT